VLREPHTSARLWTAAALMTGGIFIKHSIVALPLTAVKCVTRVYTDLAVVDVTPQGFVVREMVEISRDELQARTGAPLAFAPDCKPLTAPPIAEPA